MLICRPTTTRLPARLTPKQRADTALDYFREKYPAPETELAYSNPFELLVAVILSAQCTDARVNLTTPAIFARYPDAASMATATSEDIFPLIRSISYPNNKAKHLAGMARMLVQDFAGQVPSTMEELVRIPGVGRKTANVILSVVFDEAAIAVDTHVFRVSNRIGLVRSKNPLQTEQQLHKVLPRDTWSRAHHWLILHGRYICKARKPDCAACGLPAVCRYYQQVVAKATQAQLPLLEE